MLTVVAACVLAASAAVPSPITVDGNDADWTSPVSWCDDPIGDVTIPGYDIDFICSDYDEAADRLAFMARTVAQMNHQNSSDFVEFIFNADGDTSTGDGDWHGCVGADYRFEWDLDGAANTAYDWTTAHKPLFYTWTGSAWSGPSFSLAADDIRIAWGHVSTYSIIECTVNPALIGNPNEFVWGAYLDNGGTSPDDYAECRVRGDDDDSPEPATWVLLAATAAVGVLRRRRG